MWGTASSSAVPRRRSRAMGVPHLVHPMSVSITIRLTLVLGTRGPSSPAELPLIVTVRRRPWGMRGDGEAWSEPARTPLDAVKSMISGYVALSACWCCWCC